MFGFASRFGSRYQNMPPRLPGGMPANFVGIPKNGEKLADYLNTKAGGVSFNPLGNGLGALRTDSLLGKIAKGMWGFLGFSSFDRAGQNNKFTLRGAANFTGDYPPELVAARKKV